MKIKFILFLIIMLNSASFANAGRVKRALKALEKEKFEKVEKLLFKSLEKDTLNAGAHYVFSLLFTTEGYSRFNIDSAYSHINTAIAYYKQLPEEDKALKKLAKLDINDSTLNRQKTKVEALAFQHVLGTNTIEGYNFFIQNYATAVQVEEAKKIRNELAFQKAKRINTYDAYKSFLDTYPDAVQISEASELYEFLLYENKTKSRTLNSYITFLKEYPNTNYTGDALENIFELYTINNNPESYHKFVLDFPNNRVAKRSADYLYHLIKNTKGVDYFEENYSGLVSDSLQNVIDRDNQIIFPVYEDGFYGFKSELGDQIVPPIFKSLDENYLCGEIPEDFFSISSEDGKYIYSHSGDKVFDHEYHEITPLENGLILTQKHGKYGVLHASGFTIADPVYDSLSVLNKKYIKVRQNGDWGLLSFTGRRITWPLYSDIYAEGNFILFEKSGEIGLANESLLFNMANREPEVLSLRYDDVTLLTDDLILATDGKEEVVFNKNLQEVISQENQEIALLHEGWLIKRNDKFKVYSDDLIPISNSDFDAAFFKKSRLALMKAAKWALIDLKRNSFPDFRYDSLNLIGNEVAYAAVSDSSYIVFAGMKKMPLTKSQTFQLLRPLNLPVDTVEYLLVSNSNNYKILYDQWGKQIASGQLDAITLLGDRLFILEKNGKKGLIDESGTTLLPLAYDGIGNFSRAFVTTLKNKKFGILNTVNGKEIKPQYDITLKHYTDSLLIASKNKKLGLIDFSNKEILPFRFDEISLWNDSLAIVKEADFWLVYNIKSGQPEMTQITSIKLVPTKGEEKQAIILKDNKYGVLSSKNLELLPANYDDILNIGNNNTPLYFAEKRVQEADLFIVIYYNQAGQAIHKQSFSEAEYDYIYCY